MAFALTKAVFHGEYRGEAVQEKARQYAILTITAANTDTDLDLGDNAGTFWTAVGGSTPGTEALKAMKDITTKSEEFLNLNSEALIVKQKANFTEGNVQILSSGASAGGAATEALTVTGLGATDTILAVTQRVDGANNLPLLGWSTQIANGITGVWSADPGAGAIVDVAFQSASAEALQAKQYSVALQNSRPNITFVSTDAPTAYQIVLEWQLKDGHQPIELEVAA